MKICYVVHQFPPQYFTGTEQYCLAIARAMARRGHEVQVFTLDPFFGDGEHPYTETTDCVEGLPVTRVRYWWHLHRERWRYEHRHPYVALRFGAYLTRTEPDVVHVFHLRFLGADLLDEAHRLGIPTLVHLTDFWFVCPAVILVKADGSLCDGPPQRGLGCARCVDPWLADQVDQLQLAPALLRLHQARPESGSVHSGLSARAATFMQRPEFVRQRLLSATRIFAPSRFLTEVFAHNGFPRERLELLPYGVDTDSLRGVRGRTSLPIAFGYLGSVVPHKGLDVMIEAFRCVKGSAQLLVFGRTTDFPEYSATIAQRAAGDPRIELRGAFARAELAAVLAQISVLVVPSLWHENTPFVALEAFAAGIPVVASDLGGLAEIVTHDANGALFPRGDVKALTQILQRLVDQPELVERYRPRIPRVAAVTDNADVLEPAYEASRRSGART